MTLCSTLTHFAKSGLSCGKGFESVARVPVCSFYVPQSVITHMELSVHTHTLTHSLSHSLTLSLSHLHVY